MKEPQEYQYFEKGVWINVLIQVHFTMDDIKNETWYADDGEIKDTVLNIVEHELDKTDYCDQYVIEKTTVEDYNLLIRPEPENPIPTVAWEDFEAHANELLTKPYTGKLDPFVAAKLIQDHLIATFTKDLKAAEVEGSMVEAVQIEAELKDIHLCETYDDIRKIFIETVRLFEPRREDLANELLALLVDEGEDINEPT